MTQFNTDLVRYRIERARETLEDARILAESYRWNACFKQAYLPPNTLDYAAFSIGITSSHKRSQETLHEYTMISLRGDKKAITWTL